MIQTQFVPYENYGFGREAETDIGNNKIFGSKYRYFV